MPNLVSCEQSSGDYQSAIELLTQLPFTMKIVIIFTLISVLWAFPRLHNKIPGGGRIIGGEPVFQGELGYQLSLQRSGSHICGASLIRADIALTAAHCVFGESADSFQIIAGDVSRRENSGFEQKFDVQKIVVHENYDKPERFANDIAILFLSNAANINTNVYVVPLPNQFDQTTGNVLVSGWGSTSYGGPLPDLLMKVEIPVISDSKCQLAYPQETIEDHMLCAGLDEGGKDSCQGDSGGPLVSKSIGSVTMNKLVGIVSWGYECAAAGLPGVNTEVSHFIDWIKSQIDP